MTNTTSPNLSTELLRLEKQINSAEQQIKGYQAMLPIAEAHGMEWELERIPKAIDEANADIDCLRDEQIRLRDDYAEGGGRW